MTWGSCIGIGNDGPDGFNILFLAGLADENRARLGRENERAGLGPTITKDDALGNKRSITSLSVAFLLISNEYMRVWRRERTPS